MAGVLIQAIENKYHESALLLIEIDNHDIYDSEFTDIIIWYAIYQDLSFVAEELVKKNQS